MGVSFESPEFFSSLFYSNNAPTLTLSGMKLYGTSNSVSSPHLFRIMGEGFFTSHNTTFSSLSLCTSSSSSIYPLFFLSNSSSAIQSIVITNSTFHHITSTATSCSILSTNSNTPSISLSDTTFQNCVTRSGDALYFEISNNTHTHSLSITHSALYGCGGGIYLLLKTVPAFLQIERIAFSHNHAPSYGSTLFLCYSPSISLSLCYFRAFVTGMNRIDREAYAGTSTSSASILSSLSSPLPLLLLLLLPPPPPLLLLYLPPILLLSLHVHSHSKWMMQI